MVRGEFVERPVRGALATTPRPKWSPRLRKPSPCAAWRAAAERAATDKLKCFALKTNPSGGEGATLSFVKRPVNRVHGCSRPVEGHWRAEAGEKPIRVVGRRNARLSESPRFLGAKHDRVGVARTLRQSFHLTVEHQHLGLPGRVVGYHRKLRAHVDHLDSRIGYSETNRLLRHASLDPTATERGIPGRIYLQQRGAV